MMSKILIDEATVKLALEALEEIALAGMSVAPEMIDSKEAFHARQAWRFIGIAARALEPIKQALAEQPAQQEPVTEAQIVAGARVLNRRMADMCNIDAEDQWKQYGEDFRADARAVLEAARNIKENT